jgi:leucyl-tRNA synthetase
VVYKRRLELIFFSQKSTITLEVFPTVPAANPSLTAQMEYFRATTGAIGTAEGTSAKRLAKGKATAYDPKLDKKLTIFVAKSWPAWQTKYVEILREQLEKLNVMDMKVVSKQIAKADMKKAMPFVQGLKRKLDQGESKEAVLERKLAFDEVTVLKEMVPGLKSTVPKLKEVHIIVVDEGGQSGTTVAGEKAENLNQVAAWAEPGHPTFEFVNL